MNAKQAVKAASKHIEELEDFNRRASAEIKYLNQCIDSVIAGEKTYCDWCEDQQECQRECKGAGCSEWWLALQPEEKPNLVYLFKSGKPERIDDDDSERILSASPTC